MTTFKCTIEYDGTDFCGWQRQPRLRTIQGEFEKALQGMVGQKVGVTAAGRTDSGVHAEGQIVSFAIDRDWDGGIIQRGLNSKLPDDVIVKQCVTVREGFNARFDAVSRGYRYRILSERSALRCRDHWCREEAMDLDLLSRLAAKIIGEHDFGSFCVKKSQKESNLCTVRKSDWTKKGRVYTFRIVANRFLHGMVRSLVGTMIRVNDGTLSERQFASLLRKPDRSARILTAPARGLTLMKVNYR